MKRITREDIELLPVLSQIRFACFCARQVIHLVLEKDLCVALKAIETAEAFVVGEASSEDAATAATAANAANAAANASAAYAAAAAANAAAYAAYAVNAAANAAAAYAAAAYAANAAANAAYAAAHADALMVEQLIVEQWDVYYDLLKIDENLEKAIGLM